LHFAPCKNKKASNTENIVCFAPSFKSHKIKITEPILISDSLNGAGKHNF